MVQKKRLKIDHQRYMAQALKQAQKAFELDEVPVGAVVVGPDGTIIGRGYNQVEKRQMQSAHAEVVAINKACGKIGSWRLLDCWLYVTLEPCGMCMNLAKLSRLAGVVYGAPSPLFGYRLDKNTVDALYKKNSLRVIGGVAQENAAKILKCFFKDKRRMTRE